MKGGNQTDDKTSDNESTTTSSEKSSSSSNEKSKKHKQHNKENKENKEIAFNTLECWKINKSANDVAVNEPVFETTAVINQDERYLPF